MVCCCGQFDIHSHFMILETTLNFHLEKKPLYNVCNRYLTPLLYDTVPWILICSWALSHSWNSSSPDLLCILQFSYLRCGIKVRDGGKVTKACMSEPCIRNPPHRIEVLCLEWDGLDEQLTSTCPRSLKTSSPPPSMGPGSVHLYKGSCIFRHHVYRKADQMRISRETMSTQTHVTPIGPVITAKGRAGGIARAVLQGRRRQGHSTSGVWAGWSAAARAPGDPTASPSLLCRGLGPAKDFPSVNFHGSSY